METFVSEPVNQSYYHSLTSNNNTNIIDITPSNLTPLKTQLTTLYPSAVIFTQVQLKSLEIKACIKSLADFEYPETVYDGFTPTIKANNDLLKALWLQPRREYSVYQKLGSSPYRLKGSVALPNRLRSGAYYFEQLLGLLSYDNTPYPLNPSGEIIGVALSSNTWGLLAGNDELLLSANWELKHCVML